MKVSVIVPIFNKARYLKRCISSILDQTYTDFELILVDDGSTDESYAIARECADERTRLIQQPNRGPGAARNVGIRNSQGSLLAFLDADDVWLPTYLEDSVKLLERHRSAATVTSGYFEFPAGSSTRDYWQRRGIRDGVISLHPSDSPVSIVALLAYMSCWSTVARREIFPTWGGFYDRERCTYGEDSFLWLKVLLNERVLICTQPRVHFHREASELSNNRGGPRPVEPFLMYPELIREVCPRHLTPLLDKILAIRAFKTSCMLAYWGEWQRAQALFFKFAHLKHWRLPLFCHALALTNPVGATIIGAVRRVSTR